MPIVIKEIFSSDPISEALEKINFNFDQLILSGGGPPGPAGIQGPPGVPGSQGLRGDHWQTGGASGSLGFTGPTSDHGPNYGDLEVGDHWLDSSGKVWEWDGSMWVYSSVDLKGPQGVVGPTGNSLDLNMFRGGSGNALDGSYVPVIGPTTVSGGNANFWIINNMDINSFFLGNKDWSYNKLKNFSNLDVHNGIQSSASQRMIPKSVIIQSGIDYTGYGGLAIGAYGLTGGTSTAVNGFLGGSAQSGIVDGRSLFYAGWAINKETLPAPTGTFSHTFKMVTGYNDMEIQAGDTNNVGASQRGNINRKITLSSGTIDFKGWSQLDGSDTLRFSLGATYGRHRDLLAVGVNTSQNTTTLPTLITASDLSKLIVNGNSRVAGDLFVGMPSSLNQRIEIGYKRSILGSASLRFYTEPTSNTTPGFTIIRSSGTNGQSQISQLGTGQFEISASSASISINSTSTTGGYTRFMNSSGNEVGRFDTELSRFGVGTTTPQVKAHITGDNSNGGSVLRLEGPTRVYLDLYARGGSLRSGYLGFGSSDNNLGFVNSLAGGDTFLSSIDTSSSIRFAGLASNGVFYVGGNSIIGNPSIIEGVINANNGGRGSIYIGDNINNPSDGWKLHNNMSSGQFRIANGVFNSPNTRFTIDKTTGNVGIGTGVSVANAKLDVNGSVGINGGLTNGSARPSVNSGILSNGEIRSYSNNGAVSDDGFLRLSAGGGSSSIQKSYIDLSGYSTIPDMDKNIVFGTSGVERVRILSNGNVGIGTSSPSHKLSIYTSTPYNSASINTAISTVMSRSNIVTQSLGLGFGSFSASGGSTTNLGGWIQAMGSQSGNYTLSLNPSGGYVAIGNISASRTLSIGGDIYASSGLYTSSLWLSGDIVMSDTYGYLDLQGSGSRIIASEIRSDYVFVTLDRSTPTAGPGFFGKDGGAAGGCFIRADIQPTTPNWNGFYSFGIGGIASKLVAGTWASWSDVKLKKDIKPIENAIEKISKLRGVDFTWKVDGRNDTGFIAQEVEEVFPTWVSEDKANKIRPEVTSGIIDEGSYIKNLHLPNEWFALATEAIKELNAKIIDLENRLSKQ